ncbi:MAG: glutathione peroxidase [Acidiferrobacteraceae bacterium]
MMMPSREGQRVPEVVFKTRVKDAWRDLSSDEIFRGRSVIVFGLPGAYTPTCSSSHVPRFNELADTFAHKGIDEVICVSVNDAFVMNQWRLDQKADKITFLPDGNGEFSERMGMLVDRSDLGFGKRSWRYSMLVRDGVIEKMFIEPDRPGDPFEVSDADTMLRYLDPHARGPELAFLFTRPGCPHCARAKALLGQHGIAYEEAVVGAQVTSSAVRAATDRSTVPQIFIGGQYVGGADDLERFFAARGA